MRARAFVFACLLALVGAPQTFAQMPHQGSGEAVRRNAPWSERIIELAQSLPVQDGGRIKPLSTFADFTLLRLNGKRSVTGTDGVKQSATEWLLDVMFFPEQAATQPSFLVQDSEAIDALGLQHEGKHKRDRYSFDELRAGVPKLFSLAHDYGAIEEKNRSSVQQQVVLLAQNVNTFLGLAGWTDNTALALVPPVVTLREREEWYAPAELREQARRSPLAQLAPAHAELLRNVDALVAQRADAVAFERELGALHERSVELATSRGEYAKIPLELGYYKAQLLSWSLALFIAGFVAMALLWMRPRSRVLYVATTASVLGATLLLVATIVVRCMIRGRPPVSTLYETVLFVTAVGALLGLALEWLNRQRIAVSVVAIVGVIGLFIANGYETLDKQDTMPSLVAVLDTNFWLATHVTAITIGYSAGMLAAALASVYLLSKLVRWKRDEPSYYRTLGRMVYGVICFGMIFATVGTILGGIWANESWGRFWGWDPKENGALLIVISQIAILHGRMNGWLREHGTCMAAAFGGTVIAFSWWGVNLLGVGLHSYGFTSGIHSALWTYYLVQWGIVALGEVARLRDARAARSSVPKLPAAHFDMEEKHLAA